MVQNFEDAAVKLWNVEDIKSMNLKGFWKMTPPTKKRVFGSSKWITSKANHMGLTLIWHGSLMTMLITSTAIHRTYLLSIFCITFGTVSKIYTACHLNLGTGGLSHSGEVRLLVWDPLNGQRFGQGNPNAFWGTEGCSRD